MDDHQLVERFRSDAADLDSGATDVDALVHRALLQGRRRRTRRRIVGAVASTVAAVVVATGLSTALPVGRHDGPSSTIATPVSPAASAPTPTASGATSPPASTGRVSGSPAQVRATLTGLLPARLRVVEGSSARETGGNGFDWEHNIALTLQDTAGTSYVFGGIGDEAYADGCFGLSDCTKTQLPGGGTLWVTSSPPGDKSGRDRYYAYNRPDGGHVWLQQRTYAGGSAPVTRTGLPLTDQAVRQLVTSPRWDALFTR